MAEERKAPIPGRVTAQAAAAGSAGMGGKARASSKNLADMQEERQARKMQMGAAVIAGNRNTARMPPRAGGINEFNNAPQYTKQGHQL